MKIKERCMACKKVISNKRYYCFGCFNALEESCRIAEEQGDADYEAELCKGCNCPDCKQCNPKEGVEE